MRRGNAGDNNPKIAWRKVIIAPFLALLYIYRAVVSPILSLLFPTACRFTPTCSQYAIEAYKKHGPIKGTWLTLWRLLRCNPWGPHGHDPVP